MVNEMGVCLRLCLFFVGCIYLFILTRIAKYIMSPYAFQVSDEIADGEAEVVSTEW